MKKLRILVCVLSLAIFCLFSAGFGVSGAENYEEKVYVGGFPIGISLDIGGLLVENVTGVETEYGTANVDGLCRGDIITAIDGKAVRSTDDVASALDGAQSVTVEFIRKGESLSVTVDPVVDVYSGKPRLGVKVKDKIFGVGTVSLVRENGDYAALGHEIYDADTGVHIPFCGGKIHGCKVIGVKHGKKGEAGAIMASILSDSDKGDITCNNSFGIAGHYSGSLDGLQMLPLGSREDVHAGAAKIRSTVGGTTEYYDIEIVKASKQSGRREKSLVFRVVDEELIRLTGGVVRGMSGSPIIQDGKVIGAVTHVFLNDFTKGYGVYADCLNKVS